MANSTTNICVRIDTELKAQAETLFSELGMNISTAVTVFIRQAVRENRIPFEIKWDRPTRETAAAMRDGAALTRKGKPEGYQDPDALFRDLDS